MHNKPLRGERTIVNSRAHKLFVKLKSNRVIT